VRHRNYWYQNLVTHDTFTKRFAGSTVRLSDHKGTVASDFWFRIFSFLTGTSSQ
jgi:hypothetical protein